jgi:endonuclease-3 related protein
LEKLIRPAGYFRQKAQRLKLFVEFLDQRYMGSLPRMFARPTLELRQELLALNGVGPETADSILLYAGNHPVFVVDEYTRRILERHGLAEPGATYDEIREMFQHALSQPDFVAGCEKDWRPASEPDALLDSINASAGHPGSPMSTAARAPEAQIFNEMHGLLVAVGKHFCLKRHALCERCPLRPFPHRPD